MTQRLRASHSGYETLRIFEKSVRRSAFFHPRPGVANEQLTAAGYRLSQISDVLFSDIVLR